MSPISRTHRSALLIAATALALPLLVPATGHASQHVRTAEPPPTRTTEAACANGFESPGNDFSDIGTTGAHVRAIRCAAFHDIAAGGPGGRPDDQFGPGLDVRRDQMASFVARLLDLVDAEVDHDVLPAWDGVNEFDDVSATSPHVGAINRLADAGIVQGGPGGRPATSFGPALGVTRAQTAAFLNGVFGAATFGYFDTLEVYFDDLDGVPRDHAIQINALAEEGLLAGRRTDGGWRYDPGATVRRDQMASMLMRTLSHLVALDVVGHTYTEPAPGSGAEPVVAGGFPSADPTLPFAHLVDVRLARQDGFDRFVLEFDTDHVPAHSVRYVEPPVGRDASNEPVVFSGDAYLSVDLVGANHNMETGQSTYQGPLRLALDGNAVTEAEQIGDWEAVLSWTLGVDTQRPFTVSELTSPGRLVVDVAAP